MVDYGERELYVFAAGTRGRGVFGAVVWGLWISAERAICGSGWGAVGGGGDGAVC